jgi:hypothetical protein
MAGLVVARGLVTGVVSAFAGPLLSVDLQPAMTAVIKHSAQKIN